MCATGWYKSFTFQNVSGFFVKINRHKRSFGLLLEKKNSSDSLISYVGNCSVDYTRRLFYLPRRITRKIIIANNFFPFLKRFSIVYVFEPFDSIVISCSVLRHKNLKYRIPMNIAFSRYDANLKF